LMLWKHSNRNTLSVYLAYLKGDMWVLWNTRCHPELWQNCWSDHNMKNLLFIS
jgi:hypothetical protein